jgi:flagellar basal-body rod protein FlgC
MAMDSLFSALNISATGLSAQRKRSEIISENIANAYTTRSADGGPYKRRDVIFSEVLNSEMEGQGGVAITGIYVDQSAPRMVLEPGHPDANKDGYVAYPNVSAVREMTSMMEAQRAYEANVAAINAAKDMIAKSFEIITK